VDAIVVEVLDTTGAVVRRVTSSGKGAEAPRNQAGAAMVADPAPAKAEGTTALETPPRQKGTHLFAWDLRHEGAVSLDDPARADEGPRVVPGRYRVRVRAGGATRTVPLIVEMDTEASRVSVDDVGRQLQLALQIRDRANEATAAVVRIRAMKAQIADRVPQGKSPVIGLAGDATSRALREVEAELATPQPPPARPVTTPMPTLLERLADLRRSVQAAEGAPAEADLESFKQLSGQLDEALQRLKRVEENQINAFNRLLQNGGLAPIAVKPGGAKSAAARPAVPRQPK
jgi:hypothetical protein